MEKHLKDIISVTIENVLIENWETDREEMDRQQKGYSVCVCVCGNLLVQEGEEDKKADSLKKNQKGTLLNKMCT